MVLPEYQHCGIGRKIIETLEADEYFKRAWRTEAGSSLTAVDFYRRLGYQYKNNVTTPDEFGVVRLEKITGEKPDEVSEKYQNRRKQNQMNDNQQMIGVYLNSSRIPLSSTGRG